MAAKQRQAGDSLGMRLAEEILGHLRSEGFGPGDHVPAQALADTFHVSRSPVSAALRLLARRGVLSHVPQRGYFLSGPLPESEPLPVLPAPLERVYFRIAEDRLTGRLGETVSESALRSRYDLGAAELRSLLTRMSEEGWIVRRPGYGWRFPEMLTTPGALAQSYRLRAALEPAALLEPGFAIDAQALDRLEAVERRLLDGGAERASADALYAYGVTFHETLVAASGNPFMLDTLRRLNRVRRLLSYRAAGSRERYGVQAREHLEILDLLRRGARHEASEAMRRHLETVTANLRALDALLVGAGAPGRALPSHCPGAAERGGDGNGPA